MGSIYHAGQEVTNISISGEGYNIVIETTDSELYGETVTIKQNGTVIGTTTFDNEGHAEYKVSQAGTYIVSVTYEGTESTKSVTVSDASVDLNVRLSLSSWLTAGGVDPTDYPTFEDLDGETIRRLMLVHAAVDYVSTAKEGDILMETIIRNMECAKWINACDYAQDKFEANSDIKAIMDEVGLYGYGEIAATKDTVPAMTSNTTPSGEAKASSIFASKYPAYQAFDKTNLLWAAVENTDDQWIEYDYETSVKLGWFYIKPYITISGSSAYSKTAKVVVQGYINNEWVDISEETLVSNSTTTATNTTPTEIQGHILYSQEISKVRVLFRDKVGVQRDCIEEIKFYTYEPIGNVPVMTSNTSPYGTAFASNVYSSREPYYMFDGNSNTYANINNAVGQYFGYTSVNPICLKKISYVRGANWGAKYKIQGSNDGFVNDIHDLAELTFDHTSSSDYTEHELAVNSTAYYMSHRLYVSEKIQSVSSGVGFTTLQIYGRELKPLVPTMTSNTTPKGMASGSGYYSSTYDYYKAFDGNWSNIGWIASSNSYPQHLQYDFAETVCPKYMKIEDYSNSPTIQNMQVEVQVSNDNFATYDTIGTYTVANLKTIYNVLLSATAKYKAVRLYLISGPSATTGSGWKLQFYGMDYSEKEFAQGSTRKTIYDHGVELETVLTETTGTASISKEPNQIYGYKGNAARSGFEFGVKLDLTNYTVFGVKAGNKWYHYPYLQVDTAINANNSGQVAYAHIASTTSPYPLLALEAMCDISSVNGEYAVSLFYAETNNAGEFWGTIKEMWLE